MYREKGAKRPISRWATQSQKEEIQERERIRQAYYARLENEKSGEDSNLVEEKKPKRSKKKAE